MRASIYKKRSIEGKRKDSECLWELKLYEPKRITVKREGVWAYAKKRGRERGREKERQRKRGNKFEAPLKRAFLYLQILITFVGWASPAFIQSFKQLALATWDHLYCLYAIACKIGELHCSIMLLAVFDSKNPVAYFCLKSIVAASAKQRPEATSFWMILRLAFTFLSECRPVNVIGKLYEPDHISNNWRAYMTNMRQPIQLLATVGQISDLV